MMTTKSKSSFQFLHPRGFVSDKSTGWDMRCLSPGLCFLVYSRYVLKTSGDRFQRVFSGEKNLGLIKVRFNSQ